MNGNTCKLQRSPGENTIAVIGDSHSQHLYPGLITHTKADEGVAVFPSACAVPLMGLYSYVDPATAKDHPDRIHTEHLLSEGFSYILSHNNIKKVVLSHHAGCSWQKVVDTQNLKNHDYDSIWHEGFVRTFDALTRAGKEIYVVMDNPTYPIDNWSKCNSSVVRRPVSIPAFLTSKTTVICSEKQSERREKEAEEKWNQVAKETAAGYSNSNFPVQNRRKALCDKG